MKSRKSFAAPWKFPGIVVFFVVLTIVLTYPLSTHLTSSLRDIGDSYEYAWVLGFGAYQLLHDPLHLYSGNIFYPFPLSLAYSDSTVPSIVLGAPIIWVSNNSILAHNVVLLLTFALGGIGMYLLVAERTNSTWAAVVAGILYGFTPYRFDHLAQIPNVSMEWAPFALWCFERYFRERRQRWAAGFAFFSVLQVLVSFYYAFILGFGIAIYVVARFLGRDRSWLTPRWLGPFLGYGALGAGVAAPFILPYFTVEHAFGLQRSLAEAASFSAWPANYLASSSLMRVSLIAPFDRLLIHVQPGLQLGGSERQLYPGLTIVVLALVAGFRHQTRAIAPALMIVVGVVLSFGPVFHPSAGSSLPSLVPMPYTILFNDLPGFAALRVPSRFAALVIFGLAILAGDGLAFLIGWLAKRRPAVGPLPTVRALGAAGLVLAVVEGAASLPTHPVLTGSNVPPVYQWLAQQPHPSPVVELPIDANAFVESPRSYYSTYDHQPLVDGFRSFDPPAYGSLVSDLSTFPSGQAVSTMTWLGVRFVVVHQGELPPEELTKLKEAPIDLPIAAQFGDDVVYELPPSVRPESLALGVIQAEVARAGDETTLKAVLQRRDNGRTIVFAPGTQQVSFQLDWQGANQATFQEVVRVPITATAENSPEALDLPAHAPKQAGRYAVTVTLIDQPNASARFTIPSLYVESTASTTTGGVSSNSTGRETASAPPTLLEAILPTDRLTNATSVPYLLNWRVSGQPERPLVVFVNVYDGQNRYWSFPRGTELRFSPGQTTVGQVTAEVDSVPLKPDMPPGHYWVEAGLLDAATNQRVPFVGPNGDQVTRVVLGSFWLLPSNVIPSSGNLRSAAGSRVFGGQIALDSAQVVGTPSPGGKLRVDLRWSARDVPKADYTAFVHVLDGTGKLVAQIDAQPTGGVYPTSAWLAGDTIVDSMTVQLPANLPPGPYQIQVGLYDVKTMQRLPVTGADGKSSDDTVVIQQ